MARKLRLQFPGAIYHVTNDGNRGEPIFLSDTDRESFLTTLGQTCQKTGWRVHAYCLMPDHFQMVVETPQPNLVTGMKWLLGTYTGRFHREHRSRGHVFSGRYRSVIIGTEGGYLRSVVSHVHLIPLRTRLVKNDPDVESFPWSSLRHYLGDKPEDRPQWLECSRVFETDTAISNPSVRARELLIPSSRGSHVEFTGRGWFYGSDHQRRELLARIESEPRDSHSGPARREANEERAQRIIDEELHRIIWDRSELLRRKKGDPWKIHVALRLRSETTVTLQWIAQQLHMGSRGHLTHLLYWRQRRIAASPTPTVSHHAASEEAAEVKLRTESRQKSSRLPTGEEAVGPRKRIRSPIADQTNKPHDQRSGPNAPRAIPRTDPVPSPAEAPFEFDTRFD